MAYMPESYWLSLSKLKLFCKVGKKVVNTDGKPRDDNTSVMAATNHSL